MGGKDTKWKCVSYGAIYDARAENWMSLPNNMLEARCECSVVAKGKYVYVIGGTNADDTCLKTVYRLSLETYQWTAVAPMSTKRADFAVALQGDYTYVFGGVGNTGYMLASAERYSIADDTWEALPEMAEKRAEHCAVPALLGNAIYIVGGYGNCSLELFDTALNGWKCDRHLNGIPECRNYGAAVMLEDRYLVLIGGFNETKTAVASCCIYDCIFNQWAISAPKSIDMSTVRARHTAAVLDGKIIVAGGECQIKRLSSMEFIQIRDLLEFAPLIHPLPTLYFNQILQIMKSNYYYREVAGNGDAHAVGVD